MRGFDPGGGFPSVAGYVNLKSLIATITGEVDIELAPSVVGLGKKIPGMLFIVWRDIQSK